MPWYYAGPEAKPVGPFTLDELRARREQGLVKPETFVIEQTGGPIEALAWKKYQDVFPAATLPPVPPVPSPAIFTPPVPHPLFPSATPAATPPQTYPASARPDPYYNARRTNAWCGWGFGIAVATPFLALMSCGLAGPLAIPAILLCIVGLVQVHKHREQSGRGLAIAGISLSVVALIISVIFFIWLGLPMIKAHELTVTEQTSNDSE